MHWSPAGRELRVSTFKGCSVQRGDPGSEPRARGSPRAGGRGGARAWRVHEQRPLEERQGWGAQQAACMAGRAGGAGLGRQDPTDPGPGRSRPSRQCSLPPHGRPREGSDPRAGGAGATAKLQRAEPEGQRRVPGAGTGWAAAGAAPAPVLWAELQLGGPLRGGLCKGARWAPLELPQAHRLPVAAVPAPERGVSGSLPHSGLLTWF